MSVGEQLRGGLLCLHFEDGTKSAAQGRDLAAACRTLTVDRLDFWLSILAGRSMIHEAGIVQAEIDVRDPQGSRGTLWAFATEQ